METSRSNGVFGSPLGMAAGALLSGCAEAGLAIAALVGFGLMWAGVESLEGADARDAGEIARAQDWSTGVADLSWAGDESIRPHLVDLASEQGSR